MLIIMMSTRPHFMTYISQEFFNYLFTENLAENCRHVVIRITNPEDKDQNGRRHRSRSQGKVDPDQIMKTYGLEKYMIEAKLCKYTLHHTTNYVGTNHALGQKLLHNPGTVHTN